MCLLWWLQTQVLSAGRTIILTSHSMEEVDALASRLAIMAAGSARCLGTPQHLKSKFGDGYTLELRLGASPALSAPAAAAGVAQPEAAGTETVQAGRVGASWSGEGVESMGQDVASTGTELLAAATERAQAHFETVMPGTLLLEKEPGRLLLRLPLGCSRLNASNQPQAPHSSAQQHQQLQTVVTLSDAFEAVEAARESLCLTEYSLAQSSLERVFLSLAKAASHAADGD